MKTLYVELTVEEMEPIVADYHPEAIEALKDEARRELGPIEGYSLAELEVLLSELTVEQHKARS